MKKIDMDWAISPILEQKFWQPRLAAAHKPDAWAALEAGYSEDHRFFHTWTHIGDLLGKLEKFQALAWRPDLIAAAIFWYRSVCNTQDSNGSYCPDIKNAHDSADLFRRYTLLPENEADTVEAFIMAAGDPLSAKPDWHFYVGFEDDLNLFLDLELSVLGDAPGIFRGNVNKIRAEFSWVSDVIFYPWRVRMVRGFAKEGRRLFRRDETNATWGEAARTNLAWLIENLQQKAAQVGQAPA